MSKALPVLPDCSRHEIRNADSNDEHFLPHQVVREAFMFILATMARRYNIGIVAYAMMPNHIHILVRLQVDPTREYDLVEFKKQVRSNFALFLNAHWDDRKGAVFCRDSIGQSIKVLDADSELDQLTYIETNGVSAGLGRRPEELDGAISQRRWLTAPRIVKRPDFWFRPQKWRDEEELKLVVPTLFHEQGVGPEEFQELSTNALELRIRRVRKRRAKQGMHTTSLAELEQRRPLREAGRSVASHSRALMVGKSRVEKAREYHNLSSWWSWYESARSRARRGEEGVVFPPGTYRAAKKYGAKVASNRYFRAPVRRRDASAGGLERKYETLIENDELRVERLE